MINGYDFLKYKPEAYKQFSCKGMLFVYFDCPQAIKRVDIFTHYNIFSFVIDGKKSFIAPANLGYSEKILAIFLRKELIIKNFT